MSLGAPPIPGCWSNFRSRCKTGLKPLPLKCTGTTSLPWQEQVLGEKPCVITGKEPPLRLQVPLHSELVEYLIEVRCCSGMHEVSDVTECVTRKGEEHNRKMWHKLLKVGVENRRRGGGGGTSRTAQNSIRLENRWEPQWGINLEARGYILAGMLHARQCWRGLIQALRACVVLVC